MDATRLANNPTTTPNAPWVPFFAGLIAAGAVAAIVCQLPLPHSLSWILLLPLAVTFIAVAILASAFAVWSVCAILPDVELLDRRRLIFFATAGAAWIPLLALLFREDSLWVLAVTVLVSAGVTKSWQACRKVAGNENADAPEDFPTQEFFYIPASPSLFRRIFPSLCASICAEAGIVAVCTNHLFASSVLVGSGASIVAWHFPPRVPQEETRTIAKTAMAARGLLFLTLAIMLTSAALTPYLANRSIIAKLHAYSFVRISPAMPPRSKPHGQAQDSPEGYSSVILWPFPKKHLKIVPPAPHRSLFETGQRPVTLVVPFNGVYWYFKTPDKRPRRNARIDHGTPLTTTLRSTDWRPLMMEARQSLGNLISLDCCERIDVTVQNADHYSGNVSLELILINTTLDEKPSVSLGRKIVATLRPSQALHHQPPASDTLHFAISENEKIRQFNEIAVIFRRIAPAQALVGARIAIQQFKLVPKGL